MFQKPRLEFDVDPLRVAIVGAGRVGRVLGLRLIQREENVLAVASRSKTSAERLAENLGVAQAVDDLHNLPSEASLVLLCVPDAEIEGVGSTLAALDRNWNKTVVAHTSGVLPASILSPLEERGAVILSFHPLQAITPESPASTLDGVYAGVEGNKAEAVAAGKKLAALLGMKSVVIPTEAKPRYHLAAVMASNLFVAQMGGAEEVLRSTGILSPSASELLRPLVQGTLKNLEKSSVASALTGPVVRGDLKTLREHGKTLKAHFPHLVSVYVALSMEAVRLAVHGGRLAPGEAKEIIAFLERLSS